MGTAAARLRATGKTIAWWASLFICASAFVWHFSMVELSVLPQNTISVNLHHTVNAYVHPLFTQNWNFFAPTPIDNDISVVARVARCSSRTRCTTSQWYAVSGPLIDSVKRNRFSSLGLIQIMVDNAAMEFHNMISTSDEAFVRDTHHHKTLRPVLPYRVDPIAAEVMLRTSAVAIRSRFPQRTFDKIQVGLFLYHYPRFSRHGEPDHAERDGWIVPIEWKPYPRDIAPFIS